MPIEPKPQAKFSIQFKIKVCSHCGSYFIYQHPSQKCCSPECAKARRLVGSQKGGKRRARKEVKQDAE